KRNSLSEDTYTLTVDSKGLLQTVNLQAEDKSPAIINKIADTIVSALSAAENVGGFGTRATTQTAPERPFSVVFDPQDEEEVTNAVSVVYSAGFLLDIKPQSVGSARRRQTRDVDKQVESASRQISSTELQSHTSDG